jgi:hypothetical protein
LPGWRVVQFPSVEMKSCECPRTAQISLRAGQKGSAYGYAVILRNKMRRAEFWEL